MGEDTLMDTDNDEVLSGISDNIGQPVIGSSVGSATSHPAEVVQKKSTPVSYFYHLPSDKTQGYRFHRKKLGKMSYMVCTSCHNITRQLKNKGELQSTNNKSATILRKYSGCCSLNEDPSLKHLLGCEPELYAEVLKKYRSVPESGSDQQSMHTKKHAKLAIRKEKFPKVRPCTIDGFAVDPTVDHRDDCYPIDYDEHEKVDEATAKQYFKAFDDDEMDDYTQTSKRSRLTENDISGDFEQEDMSDESDKDLDDDCDTTIPPNNDETFNGEGMDTTTEDDIDERDSSEHDEPAVEDADLRSNGSDIDGASLGEENNHNDNNQIETINMFFRRKPTPMANLLPPVKAERNSPPLSSADPNFRTGYNGYHVHNLSFGAQGYTQNDEMTVGFEGQFVVVRFRKEVPSPFGREHSFVYHKIKAKFPPRVVIESVKVAVQNNQCSFR